MVGQRKLTAGGCARAQRDESKIFTSLLANIPQLSGSVATSREISARMITDISMV